MRLVIKLPHHLYNPGVNQMLNYGIAVKLAERDRGIDNDLTFIPAGKRTQWTALNMHEQRDTGR